MNRTYSLGEISDRSFNDKNFLFYINIEKRENRLLKNDRMAGQYLGACLDYVRVGAMNACFWDVDKGGVKGLISFISKWMSLNKSNLIWSDESIPSELQLPLINHSVCPRDDKHRGTINDAGGRVRCAHVSKSLMRPSFIAEVYSGVDRYSMLQCSELIESPLDDPANWYSEDDEFEADESAFVKYERDREKYVNEEPVEVTDPCLAILREPSGRIMSLEKILRRLSISELTKRVYCKNDMNCKEDRGMCCTGHELPNKWVGFPFCGWTLAWYVQKWYEQTPNGSAPKNMSPGEEDFHRVWPDFQVISSED